MKRVGGVALDGGCWLALGGEKEPSMSLGFGRDRAELCVMVVLLLAKSHMSSSALTTKQSHEGVSVCVSVCLWGSARLSNARWPHTAHTHTHYTGTLGARVIVSASRSPHKRGAECVLSAALSLTVAMANANGDLYTSSNASRFLGARSKLRWLR